MTLAFIKIRHLHDQNLNSTSNERFCAFRIYRKCIFLLIISFLLFLPGTTVSQRAVWVQPEKPGDLICLLETAKDLGLTVRCTSSWLNAFSVFAGRKDLEKLSRSDFHFTITPVLKLKVSASAEAAEVNYSKALSQMQANAFFRRGLKGFGVKIGVTDAGFLYLNDSLKSPGLSHLWRDRRISATRDFVKDMDTLSYTETFYSGRKKPMKVYKNWFFRLIRDIRLLPHYHGTEVLKSIAGYTAFPTNIQGMASESIYYLARTEDGRREFREEEDYYVAALEWMAEKGVRIVNTSLGYGRGRKLRGQNYSPADMNGTSMIAQAVNIASVHKNMLVVVAAGNDGDKKRWKVINTPADAEGAITVGAVLNRYEKAGYSGTGPDYNSYLKPDVAAYSAQGTSLSAPAVCGFAACLLEINPALTASELKDIILRSSHLYPYGNTYIGYGVPLAGRALQLINQPNLCFNNTQEVKVKGDQYHLQDSTHSIPYITVFHKKDATRVLNQEIIFHQKGMNDIIIMRPEFCRRSTVQAGYTITEVIWEE